MTSAWRGLPPAVLILAATHFLVDGYGNIYTPLLPLLVPRLDLSLLAVGTLQMCYQLATSVAQLGFGYVADRWSPRTLLMLGPVLSVVVLSLVGLATNVWMLGLVLVVGGLGGAAFHPPAAALVHRLAGNRQGMAMSFHITGGSLGFSMGPLLFAPFAERMGLHWTPVLMLPALVLLALALRRMPAIAPTERHENRGLRVLRPYAKPLTLLYLIVVLRTLAALSFSTFMPVMLTRRGMSVTEIGAAVALYLVASSLGGFLGGPLADRWGARRVIMLSLAGSAPFLATAPALDGWTFVIVLAVGGFLLQSTLPVNVTFAQTLAPVSAATVSSLMMGFGWGSGGLMVPLVGLLADDIGIERALMFMAAAPLAAAAAALPLPSGRYLHTAARASDVAAAETAGPELGP